jgi:hypothetical protein
MPLRAGAAILCVFVAITGVPVSPALAAPPIARASTASRLGAPSLETFAYTGAMQTWIVPSDVIYATFVVSGAQGGQGDNNFVSGGLGGRTSATLPVSAGATVNIFVGGAGSTSAGGFNGGGANALGDSYGGGGGGASDIRIGGTTLADRVLIAGGGGGAGSCSVGGADSTRGGAGGGLSGGAGTADADCTTYFGNQPGTGATQSAGGTNSADGAANGTLGTGGNGIAGGGGSFGGNWGGAGGGGGYYGGAGGVHGGGGGGGSAFGPGDATFETGVNTGNGSVTIQAIRACPAGTYSLTGDDRAGCTAADTGHYVSASRSTAQQECDFGTYQPSTGQSSCLPADVGFYVDHTGASSQTACPSGQTTSGTASDSVSDCFTPPTSTPSPYERKQAAAAELQALLPTGDKLRDALLTRAIARINGSLQPWRWMGEDALNPAYGWRVFAAERKAVRWLWPYFHSTSQVGDAVHQLVAADRTIAVKAIEASTDSMARVSAEARLAQADVFAAKGQYAKAIKALGSAWRAVN